MNWSEIVHAAALIRATPIEKPAPMDAFKGAKRTQRKLWMRLIPRSLRIVKFWERADP